MLQKPVVIFMNYQKLDITTTRSFTGSSKVDCSLFPCLSTFVCHCLISVSEFDSIDLLTDFMIQAGDPTGTGRKFLISSL
jgi:hypothetical protein